MTERQQRAQELHGKGYNCAQSVVCAYCDLVGLDEQTAYKMAEGFGLGMGRNGYVRCAEQRVHARRRQGFGWHRSARHDQGADLSADPRDGECFKEKNGTYLCRELKASPTAMSTAPAPAASRMRARWSRRCSVCKKQNR